MRMGEALGKSCANFSTHVCVASAVSIAASLITEPPGQFLLWKKIKDKGNASERRDAKSTAKSKAST
jgi:hypothetical protein